jgi:hypothetical protein
MKVFIEAEAARSGRTQSQVVEAMLERARTYDQMLAAANQTMGDLLRGRLESALRNEGYTPVHSPYGKIWYPPDYPLRLRSSGFITDEGEKP